MPTSLASPNNFPKCLYMFPRENDKTQDENPAWPRMVRKAP